MANGNITASIVVNFGDADSNSVLSAEVDGRETVDGGRNNGNTSFSPGDSVYILLYKTTNVVVTNVEISAGSIVKVGTDVIAEEEFATFADTNEASVTKPVNSSLVTKWLGNNLGPVALSGETSLKSGISGVGVLKVNYNTVADVYRISSPTSLNAETIFPILTVFTGTT